MRRMSVTIHYSRSSRVIAAAALAACTLGLLSACHATKSASSANPLSSSSHTATSSAPSIAPSTPTSSTAPAAPPLAPATLAGKGDDVVTVPAGYTSIPAVIHITGNTGGVDNFSVQASDNQLLVNTVDAYNGYVPLDFKDAETSPTLQISAGGPWSLTFAPVNSVPQFSAATTGTGDTVLEYVGKSGVLAVTGNAGGVDNFSIIEYGTDGTNLLVNTVDPYTGRVPIQSGPEILVISAANAWTLSVTSS
jgi:hypothetical protein